MPAGEWYQDIDGEWHQLVPCGRCGFQVAHDGFRCESCGGCWNCCDCGDAGRLHWVGGTPLAGGILDDPDSMEDEDKPYFWNRSDCE
jgi:hypothetical protein